MDWNIHTYKSTSFPQSQFSLIFVCRLCSQIGFSGYCDDRHIVPALNSRKMLVFRVLKESIEPSFCIYLNLGNNNISYYTQLIFPFLCWVFLLVIVRAISDPWVLPVPLQMLALSLRRVRFIFADARSFLPLFCSIIYQFVGF